MEEADWFLFSSRGVETSSAGEGRTEWAALSTAGMIQEWAPFDNSQVNVVFSVTLSMGMSCFQTKCISLPWKTFVEQMLSVLSLSTKLWYKASKWLQQVLLPLWLIPSYVELCHVLAALQRTLNLVWFKLSLQQSSLPAKWSMPSRTSCCVLWKAHVAPGLGRSCLSPTYSSSSIRMQLFLMTGLKVPHSAIMLCKAIFGVLHQHRVCSLPSLHLLSDPLQCREGQL